MSTGSDDTSDLDAILRKVAHAPPRAPGATVLDGRYELGELLGEGSFGAVYEALDRTRGERVAVKVLQRASSSALLRFKREFRSLARLTDPSFVKLYDLHGDGDRWFFTMERVHGVPFDAYVRDQDKLRPALAALARALTSLHRAGYVHRDVKPSNVLVEAGGRVVLLDFGLVQSVGNASQTAMAGTPVYLAPEIASGHPPSAAADRYAVGVILYEALTGELPFEGTSAEILEKKKRGRPAPVLERAPGAPQDLARLADALLDPDPSSRPEIDVDAILELESSRCSNLDASFVGREAELLALRDACARERVVRVSGPSGVGKSSLVDRFAEGERARGKHVLVSRCHPRDHVPFLAVDGIVDELARRLAGLPPALAATVAPRDVDALVRAFPVLRAIPGFDVHAPRDSARSRVATALVELLGRWVRPAPWLLVIDDAQWGDADSAALLRSLVESTLPLTILLVHREGTTGPLLDELGGDGEAVQVGVMSEEDARALARTLGVGAALDDVVKESGRHPLFLVELAREAAEGGSCRSLSEIVRAREAALSREARRALHLLVVAGSPLKSAVSRASGVSSSAIDELRAQRLVVDHDVDSVRVVHDRVLDVIASALDEGARRPLHAALAEALLAAAPERAEALAYHLAAAGDRDAAAEHLRRAARDAARAHAFAQARALYGRLLALEGRDKALRLEAAEVSALLGRSVEAAEGLLAASRLTSGDEGVTLRVRAAEHLLLAGHRERGERILDGELRHLGLAIPSSKPLLAIDALRHTIGRRVDRFTSRRTTELRAKALWAATRIALLTDPLRGLALGTCFTREAARPGATPYDVLASAFVEGMALCARQGPGGLLRARARIDAALADRSDPVLLRMHAFAEGFLRHQGLEFAESLAAFARVTRVSVEHQLGLGYEESFGRGLAGASAFVLGDIAYMQVHTNALCAELEERDQLLAWVLSAFHSLYIGFLERGTAPARLGAAEVRRRWSSRGFELQDWWFDLAEIHFSLADGDAKRAMRLAHPSSRGFRERVVTTFFHRLEARILYVRASIAARQELAGAERAVAEIASVPSAWARGQACCLRAGLASARGDRAGAVAALRLAAPALDEARMPLLRALVDDALGTLLAGDEGRGLRDAGRARLAAWRVDRDIAMACTLPGGF